MVWIGLRDDVAEGVMRWENGYVLGWDNWGNGEPRGAGSDNCVGRNVGGFWDFDCTGTTSYRYMCQVRNERNPFSKYLST